MKAFFHRLHDEELEGGRAGVSKASGFVQRMMAEQKAGVTSGKRGFRKFDWKELANAEQSGKNKHDSDYGASPDILHRFGNQEKLPESLRAQKGRLEAMARRLAKAMKEKPEDAKAMIAQVVAILNQKQPYTIAHEVPKNTLEMLQETPGVPPSMVKKLETAEAVQADLPKSERPEEIPSFLEHFGNLNTDLFSGEPLQGLEVRAKPKGEEQPAATRPSDSVASLTPEPKKPSAPEKPEPRPLPPLSTFVKKKSPVDAVEKKIYEKVLKTPEAIDWKQSEWKEWLSSEGVSMGLNNVWKLDVKSVLDFVEEWNSGEQNRIQNLLEEIAESEGEKWTLNYDDLIEDDFSWMSADRYEKQREILGYLAENAYRLESVKLGEISDLLKKKGYTKGIAPATLSEQFNDMRDRLRGVIAEERKKKRTKKSMDEILEKLKDTGVKSKLKSLLDIRSAIQEAKWSDKKSTLSKERPKLEYEKALNLWAIENKVPKLLGFLSQPSYDTKGKVTRYAELGWSDEDAKGKDVERDEFEVINSPWLGLSVKVVFKEGKEGKGNWGLWGKGDSDIDDDEWEFSPIKKGDVYIELPTLELPLYALYEGKPVKAPRVGKDGLLYYDDEENPFVNTDAEEELKKYELERPKFEKPPSPNVEKISVKKGKELEEDYLKDAEKAGIKVAPKKDWTPKNKNDKVIWNLFLEDGMTPYYKMEEIYKDAVAKGYDADDFLDSEEREPAYWEYDKNIFVRRVRRLKERFEAKSKSASKLESRKERIVKDVKRTKEVRGRIEKAEEKPKPSFNPKDWAAETEKKKKRVRELRAEGMTYKAISEKLTAEGISSVSPSEVARIVKQQKKGGGKMCGI